MFVVSVSKNKIKKTVSIGVAVIVLSLLLVLLLQCFRESHFLRVANELNLTVATESDMLSFISNYGWQVDDEPVEVREIIIPETFDDVYSNYNKIQLEQGFDLEKYSGRRVKKWTYIIRNYPETLPSDDFVRINILVCDGVVIGGDVSSVKLDGFMHGFSS